MLITVAPPDPAPADFLVQDASDKPATVSTDSHWTQILSTAKFVNQDVDALTAGGDGNLTISTGDDMWNLQFSSATNGSYFGSALTVDKLLNNAWIGDQFNSGAVVLSPTQPTDIFTRDILLQGDSSGSVWKAFGISNANAQLLDFIKAIDPAKSLTVKLRNSPGPDPNPSALWCVTTSDYYQTTVKLEFDLNVIGAVEQSPFGKAIDWINTNLQLAINLNAIKNAFTKIPDILISATKTTLYDLDDLTNTSEDWTISFQFSILKFNLAFQFSNTDTAFYVTPTEGTADIVGSLVSAVGSPNGLDRDQMPTTDKSDPFTKLIGDHLNLWYVKILKDFSKGASTPASWSVALLASWKVGGTKNIPLLIGLTYESSLQRFGGRLILNKDPVVTNRRYPDYDYRFALPRSVLLNQQGIDVDNIPESISLWDLIMGDSGTPPKVLSSIPFSLTSANLSYQTLQGSKTLSFSMNIARDKAQQSLDPQEAPSGFLWNLISVLVMRRSMTGQPGRSTHFEIYSAVELAPKDTFKPSAFLNVLLTYDNTTGSASDWMFRGSLNSLSVGLLADVFFNDGCSAGAKAVLGSLNLNSLNIQYTYSSGKSSSFLITAVLILGELELDLSYQYVSELHQPGKPTAADLKWGDHPPNKEITKITPDKTTRWAFEAFLRVKDQSSTIASIANSIVPGKGDSLPAFVGNIVVAAKGDPLNAPIKLIYTGDNMNGSTLAVWVNIGPFNMTFIQYRSTAKDGKTAVVKRILRISVDQIPMIEKVPLLNQLPQPFDHLIYLWVDDDTPAGPMNGITRQMIDTGLGGPSAINSTLGEVSIPPIQWKETKNKPDITDLVLQTGHHFIVVTNNKVVLDHVFEHSEQKPKKSLQGQNPTTEVSDVTEHKQLESKPITSVSREASGAPAVTTPNTESEAPATKGDSNTQAGPLTISALSLQYKNGSLFVGIDATLVLGPLTFSVVGFTIEIVMGDPKFKLDSLIDVPIKVSIHGLDASVEKDPLTIAAGFIHDTTVDAAAGTSVESYRGGVAVGFKAWKVLAVGEYAIVTTISNGSQYKSVFIYGKLDGPLVELEFATISGVRLGFGYNSLVRFPSASQLHEFPFISDSGAAGGNDPMAIINLMEGGPAPFVYKKEGGCWFCAGMTITCFDCITLTAVLMFDIETKSDHAGVVVALLADGVFQMEPLAAPDASLFYVELLIKVELNFIEGYIAADAALSPASHVYVPEAHLTGSGSFYTWFPPNSHAGDWVVTIGGYHRAYQPPAHYPQNLIRLGLDFAIGNGIHVTGGAYVAVTPKCAMAGGSLHISLDAGPVSAYADIALDVFINFKPFYFIAEIRLSVGVDCEIDLLFVSFHISISLGADLTLWGPHSFGGTAYVDFWFFGFSIDFGSGLRDPPPASLIEFYEMVRTAGPDSAPPPNDKTSANNLYQAQHKYSIENGLFPGKPKPADPKTFPNTGAATEWKVLAGPLQIRIDCDFSLSGASLVIDEKDPKKPKLQAITTNPPTALNSIYAFPMHNVIPIKSELVVTVYLLEGGEAHKQLIPDFRAELVLKQAPMATWSQYTPDNDPLHRISGGGLNKPSALEQGADPTVELCQGVRLFPPVAILSPSPVIDFDATAAMMEAYSYSFPAFDKVQDTYLSEGFESTADPSSQWSDFGKMWKGDTDGQTTDDAGETVSKSELRGDGSIDAGIMGLLATTLGWTQRRPAETVKNEVVPAPKNADGSTQRQEWQLASAPPTILADELDNYYPYLPMVTVVATAA